MKPTSSTRLRWSVVRAIFGKEMLETLRDRRTLFLLIAIPMIFYPLLLVLITEVTLSQTEKIQARRGIVSISGAPLPEALRELVEADEGLQINESLSQAPEDALRTGEVQALVHLPSNYAQVLAREGTAQVIVRYDSVKPLSHDVRRRMEGHIQSWRRDLLAQRLARRGIPDTFDKPLDIEEVDIAPRERQLGSIVSQFLPMLVLIFMVTGAFYPAIDLTAGEKERKTIQTLLSSPVRPLEIVTGKYLTVFVIAMISGIINIASILLILGHNLSMMGDQASSFALDLSLVDGLALFWVVFLLGAMFSALMMTIATLADTPKSAQSYLSPVYMLCLVPVMIAQIPGVEMSETTAFVPVLNLSLAMKEILVSGASVDSLFLVSLSTLAMTVLILTLAAKLYQREELLMERSGARGLFSPRRGAAAQIPSPGQALMLLAVLFIVFYYLGTFLQSWNLLAGVAITLIGGFLIPVLIAIKVLKLDYVQTLRLRKPPALGMLAALLLGVSSFVWVSAIIHAFHDVVLPVPEAFEALMRDAFTAPETWTGRLLMLVVVAVVPAFCEEALFRGWLLSSLRGRLTPWVAIILTAVIFGAFHLSIYRFLGTAALGIIMGWMVWRTGSIWPAVLYHFLNNASSILSEDVLKLLGVDTQAEPVPVWLLALSVTLSVLGFLCLVRVSARAPEEGLVAAKQAPSSAQTQASSGL